MTDADPFDSPPLSKKDEDDHDIGVKRDRHGRYLLPHPDTMVEQAWTRVTTLAKSASDTFTLDRWGLRMALKGLAARPDLVALVASLPIEEKKKLNDIGQQCKDAMASGARANWGTALHKFTEDADKGEDIEMIQEPWRSDVKAYVAEMQGGGVEIIPEYIERICPVPELDAAGTFDRIVRLPNGELVIADLKTGSDLSYGWAEIAIQLACYANAAGLWNKDTLKYDKMPVVSKTKALVMHLPVGEKECKLYWVNIKKGWQGAQLCKVVRDWRKVDGFAVPYVKPQVVNNV